MLWNSRIQVTRRRRPTATGLILCCLCSLSLSSTGSAADDPVKSRKEEHRLKQQELVQSLRQIRENLLTEDVKNEWNRIKRDYASALSSGVRSDASGMKAIKSGLQYRIYSATDPANLDSPVRVQAVLTNLLNDFKRAARNIQSRSQKEEFRTQVCEVALPLLRELLDNSYEARSFAIEVLPELRTVAAGGSENRNIIYDQVDDTLIEILNDPEQPDAVKIRAASSIGAYLDVYDPGSVPETEFVKAIQKELEDPVRLSAYQYYLVVALSKVRSAREAVGVRRRAAAIETLAKVMQDPDRDHVVRCRAARALGEAGFDQQINFEPLAWKVTQLAVEAGSWYQQNPDAAHRDDCGWNLYLAFHHMDQKGRDDKKNPQGFLNRASRSQAVRDAYDKTLPIARAMIFEEDIAAQDIIAANNWVKENVPANRRFDDNSDPVTGP